VPPPPRDLRLDFFRGLALIFIFADHIPENILSYFTLQAVQFFDAAEVFIFISGYTAALVYNRTLAARGASFATAQTLRRAWQLYVAHIFLFVIFIAEVSYVVTTFKNPMYNDEMRVGDFLDEPHIAIVRALTLQFQPTFLDILPLYIILLILLPVILLILRFSSALILSLSLLIYVIVQITGLSVPAYPEGHVWYFNPLAWQFLFTVGAVLGWGTRSRWLRPRGTLLFAAAGIAGSALVVKLSWTVHGVWDPFPGLFLRELWPLNKNNLSPLRLLPFFATVVLVAAFVSHNARFLRGPAAKAVILCGQQSLEVFCLGILLSALGHFVLAEYRSSIDVQLAVNVTGIFALCMTARLIDWYKAVGRAPPTVPVSGSREEINAR
jgi:hypothetical protein